MNSHNVVVYIPGLQGGDFKSARVRYHYRHFLPFHSVRAQIKFAQLRLVIY